MSLHGSPSLSGPGAGSPGAGNQRAARAARAASVLSVACILLIALDVALVLRVRSLNERVGALTRSVLAAERPVLVEGELLPALSLLDPEGHDVALLDPAAAAGTLLLISSDSCGACEEVRPVWDAVARRCAGSHLRVLELVLDAEPERLTLRQSTHPVLASGGDAAALVRRLPLLPAAILVDAGGRVSRSFYGPQQDGLPQAVEDELSG